MHMVESIKQMEEAAPVTPVTGTDPGMHAGSTGPSAVSRFETYGDEAARLEDLRSWDYDQFKKLLLELNNDVRGDEEEPVSDFYQNYNAMGAGWMGMAGVNVHFPIPQDQEDLLQYALEKAQAADDVQDAALILGTAVVKVHPFADGNGRTSRALYARLSRGWDETDEEYRRVASPHKAGEQDDEAREEIDLGSVFDDHPMDGYINTYPYLENELDTTAAPRASFDHYKGGGIKFPSPKQLPNVSKQDYDIIWQATGVGQHGYLATTDVRGLQFALTKVLQRHDLMDTYASTKSFPGQDSFLAADLPRFLRDEDSSRSHELAEAIKEYRRLVAKGAIDFLTDEVGGKAQVPDSDGNTMPIKDLLIQETNNYHPSKLLQQPAA